MNISQYKVASAPPTILYIPNFITPQEESEIIKYVYSVPKPKWTCLSNRRLQDYGGVPHEKGMIQEKIPAWLKKYMDKVAILNVFDGKAPNQVLINEYLPGQGIMPHTDGPLFYPTVTTITCGSHTVLEFLENTEKRRKICDILLERRSLVIVKDDMYSKYLHSIRETETDNINTCANLEQCDSLLQKKDSLQRDTRISLTIRNVPKVVKINFLK